MRLWERAGSRLLAGSAKRLTSIQCANLSTSPFAAGVTDMRRGMDGLAAQRSMHLERID
jgi:hypothetical protein